ncbi:SusC/RagA family TonB-linked outer membrane protein [Parapedobacter sp. 10938]|uniref:SusC/RagA family TonB-linked outer membrane protein n=1 Tax=Parapedobacter flavus TaxID=3110225 RepID=UPI002DBF30BE|nr:TonB-dependent receptor [Parapedobacter sp. 10938]MEC3880459.1 TonB-dependent receptor [Parapedobacter sp. 10938]
MGRNIYVSPVTSFLLYLKVTAFFIVLASLQIHAKGVAQTVRLDMSNGSVTALIKDIQRQTGYAFLYNRDDIMALDAVNISIESDNIREVLAESLKGLPLDFLVKEDEKVVILKRNTSKAKRERILASLRQQSTVSGIVVDTSGTPLTGVTVSVKDQTNMATSTDVNGRYVLEVPEDAVLVITMVGYQTQEINVGNRKEIDVVLEMSASMLDDVVVVGFGTQKKREVVGSVTSVSPGDLKVPSSNLTTALAGQAAGIIAYQRSGEPGQDNADFFVRGITTFGTNTNPLILIDGIELSANDLARLRPDDIQSFSILKDATATALYGSRGANGVILVTTKQGKEGPAKFSFRFENSISAPTRTVDVADPVTYMKMHNEAILTRDPEGSILYSQEKIEMTEQGRYPLIYPANDWKSMLFKNYTMNQRSNVNVSGGGGVARYYVAGSFNRDNGILNVDKRNNFNNNIAINNYDLRSTVNIDLSKRTELIVRLSANFEEYKGPLRGGADMYNLMVHSNPVLFPAYYPADEDFQYAEHILFGNFNNSKINPYAEMVRGYKEKSRSQILAQLELKQDLDFITPGLTGRGMLNISRLSQFAVNRAYTPFYHEIGRYNRLTGDYKLIETEIGTEYLGYGELQNDREQYSTFYFEGSLNHVRDFGKNNISSMLVFQARETLTANAGSLQLSLPSRNLGVAGRATYSYDSRYFAEFNFGYNGSERFDKNNRFGFFPSAGVAWLVSNEPFWDDLKPVVSNLKLRYTYGLIGNDQIGTREDRFFYLSEVNMNNAGRRAIFGSEYNTVYNGITISRYANPYISWEKSYKQNFALELGLWNDLNIVTEYFTEKRDNILMTRASIPNTMGLTATPRANVGEASGKGVDMMLEYQKSWNPDFWTSARANFTYATSQYDVYEEPEYNEPWRSRVGMSLKQVTGYIAERLFVDDEEAASSPPQYVGTSEYGGGDIKYLDVNRDGRITEADRVPLGHPEVPEIVYGFGVSMGYKGFDFSVLFQGAARQSFWINAYSTAPFLNDAQILQAYADSYWSEENQNLYATWPRLDTRVNTNNVPGAYIDGNGNQQWAADQRNTWFMRNGNFLRVKQMELGYTVPSRLTERIKMNNLRLYLSGTNLLVFSKFKMWDVEMAGNGLGYPNQRVFNIGLNFDFN